MKSWGVVLTFSLLITSNSWAVLSCPTVHSTRTPIATKPVEVKSEIDFISQERKVEIPSDKGESFLTYSIDSEISLGDCLRYISTSPEISASLTTAMKQYRFSTADILNSLKISLGQLNSFGLKKSVVKDQAEYSLADFNPEYFESLVKAKELSGPLQPLLLKALNTIFTQQNIPLNAGTDIPNVELRHNSSESIPGKFKNLVLDLHKKTKLAMTHMHVGIPSQVSHAKVSEIARAVEADIILTLAKDGLLQSGALPYTYFTSLNETQVPKSVDRGVIRLGYEEFHAPETAHNLEVRQYANVKHGFSLLTKASLLAQAYKNLIITETHLKPVQDDYTSNLPGALYHVGKVLGRSADSQDQLVARQLLDFSARIYREAQISNSMRVEISKFLLKYNPLERVKLEYYISSEPTADAPTPVAFKNDPVKKEGVIRSLWNRLRRQ